MTQNERSDYGYRLHTMRLAAGLTTREVGEACGYSGLTADRTIKYWEHGDRLPGIEHLRPLAIVLKVPVSQVVP